MRKSTTPVTPDVKLGNVPLSDQLKTSRGGILSRLQDWEAWLGGNPNWGNIVSSFASHASRSNSRASVNRLINIKLFASYIAVGVYPPPKVLFDIAASFAEYLDGRALSLERAFRLRPKPKTGTPVKELQDVQRRGEVLWLMAAYKVKHPGISIENAAAAVCGDLQITQPDSDTFARHYRAGGIGKRLQKDYQGILDYQSGK